MRRPAALAACLVALLAGVWLASQPATAQDGVWTGPDFSRRPTREVQADLDFALSEMCFPYLLQNAEVEDLVERRGIRVSQFGDYWWSFGRNSAGIDFVGEPDRRGCMIRITEGDQATYVRDLSARMATWPFELTAQNSWISEAGDQRVLRMCGTADGRFAHVLLEVELGSGQRGDRTALFNVRLWRALNPIDECAPELRDARLGNPPQASEPATGARPN